ncbi:unnamed protein product [Caenorhabditis brenneri]
MEPSKKKMRMTLRSDSKKPAVQPFPQPSRFKLPKLPLLAQVEVIRMMTAPEQYLLSKCSRRTSKMVKTSMPKINNHEIWVEFDHYEMNFYLKIAGSTVLIHTSSGKFSVEEHKHICDVFKAPPEVYVIWENSDSFSKRFSVTSAVKRTNMQNKSYRSSLKELFDLHPEQDLVLFNGEYTRYLKSGHSFFEARNLMLSSSKHFSPYPILSSFRGEHLLMEDVPIHTFYVQTFVNKWMRKKNDRLKSVICQLEPGSVFGNLKYDKFSESDRKFQYDSPIKDYHKFPNGLFDCSEGYEIRRETDGKVATIKITEEYLLFLVW